MHGEPATLVHSYTLQVVAGRVNPAGAVLLIFFGRRPQRLTHSADQCAVVRVGESEIKIQASDASLTVDGENVCARFVLGGQVLRRFERWNGDGLRRAVYA